MAEKLDLDKLYSLEEAVDLLKQCPPVKFDQTVELLSFLARIVRSPPGQGIRSVRVEEGRLKTEEETRSPKMLSGNLPCIRAEGGFLFCPSHSDFY